MNLRFETTVNLNACEIWKMEKEIARLDRISRPFLSLKSLSPEEKTWRQGGVYRFKIKLFCLIPWAVHEVRMPRYCNRSFSFQTDEAGGPVKVWKHTHQVIPVEPNRSICRDEIEIHAGAFNPFVWVIAQALYRKRHRALRQIH